MANPRYKLLKLIEKHPPSFSLCQFCRAEPKAAPAHRSVLGKGWTNCLVEIHHLLLSLFKGKGSISSHPTTHPSAFLQLRFIPKQLQLHCSKCQPYFSIITHYFDLTNCKLHYVAMKMTRVTLVQKHSFS